MDPHLPRRMSSANPFASLFRGTSQDGFDHTDPPEPSLNDQLEEIFSFTLNEKATLTKEVSIHSVAELQNFGPFANVNTDPPSLKKCSAEGVPPPSRYLSPPHRYLFLYGSSASGARHRS